MATEKQISVNYSQAKSCASTMEEEADKLRKLAEQEFGASIAEIRTAWKGENAELYIQKCEQLKEEMLSTAKTLAAIASAVRSQAQAIYNAEMENLRIIQEKAAAALRDAAGIESAEAMSKEEIKDKMDDVMAIAQKFANLLK